jgi:hypothetical protein
VADEPIRSGVYESSAVAGPGQRRQVVAQVGESAASQDRSADAKRHADDRRGRSEQAIPGWPEQARRADGDEQPELGDHPALAARPECRESGHADIVPTIPGQAARPSSSGVNASVMNRDGAFGS